jgi:hypothetical protein
VGKRKMKTQREDVPKQQDKNHSSDSVLCKNDIDKLRNAIKSEGLVICASKNHGKTNSLMVLCSDLNGKAAVCLIDYASQHCFRMKDFQVRFLNKDYLLKKPRIKIEHNTILDFSQTTKAIAGEILRDIIKREYYDIVQTVIKGFREGKTREGIMRGFKWLIFAIEESASLIGRYIKSDDDLNIALTQGRNYRIGFVFLTQRLASLNADLVEKCSYLVGKQLGSNNLRRLSSVLGMGRKKLKFIETLSKGEFVFYEGSRLERIKFPKFEGYGKAYEIGREIIYRKPRSLWRKMKDAFSSKREQLETEYYGTTESAIDEEDAHEDEEDAWLEEEEEEWFGEDEDDFM